MDQVKERIGEVAATLVQDGMLVGLGTGSTANYFIHALAKRYHEEGLVLATVSSSHASEQLAREVGLPFVLIDAVSEIDITFDGADEIDPQKRLIKGRGGALLREKILAFHSKELVILVDESKQVDTLGSSAFLPIEVTQFGLMLTMQKLRSYATNVQLRRRSDNKPFITENGHYILDVALRRPIESYETLEQDICQIPGVLETGFFFNMTGRVVVGRKNTTVEIIN